MNANLEAVVTLPLRGPAGRIREEEAVVDTDFNGYLALPPGLAADMELPFVGDGEEVLADGNEVVFDVCGVTVLWDGWARCVESGAVGPEALVGMSMLEGHDLRITVGDGGPVAISVTG